MFLDLRAWKSPLGGGFGGRALLAATRLGRPIFWSKPMGFVTGWFPSIPPRLLASTASAARSVQYSDGAFRGSLLFFSSLSPFFLFLFWGPAWFFFSFALQPTEVHGHPPLPRVRIYRCFLFCSALPGSALSLSLLLSFSSLFFFFVSLSLSLSFFLSLSLSFSLSLSLFLLLSHSEHCSIRGVRGVATGISG